MVNSFPFKKKKYSQAREINKLMSLVDAECLMLTTSGVSEEEARKLVASKYKDKFTHLRQGT